METFHKHFKQNKDVFKFPQEEIFALQVALLFESVGRESDISYKACPSLHDKYDQTSYKIDLRGESEEKRLIEILNSRCNDFIDPNDIICTSASPQTIAVAGRKPYQPAPEINSLIRRLANILHEEGEELIADNILLQCSNIGKEGKNLLIKQRTQSAKKCIDKYGWLSSGALILTPLPVLDMIAAAAVNAQMVIEIAKIHGVKLTNERAKNLALSVGKILATMGLVKGGVSLISSTLSLSLPTLVISKVIQGISVSWLTRIAGASFITYFQQDQDWGDGGIQEVVEYHYNLNKREEYFKSFIRRAYERVIDPLVEKNLKKLPPRSRPPASPRVRRCRTTRS